VWSGCATLRVEAKWHLWFVGSVFLMLSLFSVVIIFAVAYFGSIFIFEKEKLPTPLKYMFYSGWEFILLGIALSPVALNFFPAEMLANIDIIIQLGLGWVGLFIGIQLREKDLSKVQDSYLLIIIFQSLLTGILVAISAYFAIKVLADWSGEMVLMTTLIFSASSALSSPTILVLLGKERGFKAGAVTLFHLITNLDMVLSIFAVGFLFTLLRPNITYMEGGGLLLQSILVGALLAFLFKLMPRNKFTKNETIVVLIGFVLFSSGIGGILQVSPLFLNMICGIILANTLKSGDPLYSAIINLERPFYIIILIISGLMFTVPQTRLLYLVPLIVLIRIGSKLFFMSIIAPKIVTDVEIPKKAGLALTSQGAMALVIGFAFVSVFPGEISKTVFSLIVLMVIANEMIAPYLVKYLFRESFS